MTVMNLAALSTRRWCVPLAPDPESESGELERVVASCYDPESGVVYCVTNACTLYGVRDRAPRAIARSPEDPADPAPDAAPALEPWRSPDLVLEMSLVGVPMPPPPEEEKPEEDGSPGAKEDRDEKDSVPGDDDDSRSRDADATSPRAPGHPDAESPASPPGTPDVAANGDAAANCDASPASASAASPAQTLSARKVQSAARADSDSEDESSSAKNASGLIAVDDPSLEAASDGEDIAAIDATALPDPYAPALPARAPIVGMEYVPELRGVCVAVFTGELILVAPDPDDPRLVDPSFDPSELILTPDLVPECVGRVAQGLRAMAWCPDGETLTLCTWAGTLISMTKEFHVLAEAPVGGGGGDGVANISWRGDGQFMATLVAPRGADPTLRVWEREDLEFHATAESVEPRRMALGDDRAVTDVDAGDFPRARDGRGYHPPLAWQPRGALIAAACVPLPRRPDLEADTDTDREQGEGAEGGAEGEDGAPTLAPTEAEILFFERNGLLRDGFKLPKPKPRSNRSEVDNGIRGVIDETSSGLGGVVGNVVIQLAWSPDSALLAVVVARDELDVATGARAPTETGVLIYKRGNAKWDLKRELRYDASEGAETRVQWGAIDHSDPRTCDVTGELSRYALRVFTAAGGVEELVFGWDVDASPAGTVAVVDGEFVRVTPAARGAHPPPMCAAVVRFPAPVADLAWLPSEEAPGDGEDPPGEAFAAVLSDGRLAVCSAMTGTAWEETAEAMEELEAREGATTTTAQTSGGGLLRALLDAAASTPSKEEEVADSDSDADANGAFSVAAPLRAQIVSGMFLEHPGDRPTAVAWLDRECALVASENSSTRASSLLLVKTRRRNKSARDAEGLAGRDRGWTCHVECAVDLPARAVAIAPCAGAREPRCAFVQLQRGDDAFAADANESDAPTQTRGAFDEASSPTNLHASSPPPHLPLFAAVVEDPGGDLMLEVTPAAWPSAALPVTCAVLRAAPGADASEPPALFGLEDGGTTLWRGGDAFARDVRSFAVHWRAGDGAVAVSGGARDAADVSWDVAASVGIAWGGGAAEAPSEPDADEKAGSPRRSGPAKVLLPPKASVAYVTTRDELRIADADGPNGDFTASAGGDAEKTTGGGDDDPSAAGGGSFGTPVRTSDPAGAPASDLAGGVLPLTPQTSLDDRASSHGAARGGKRSAADASNAVTLGGADRPTSDPLHVSIRAAMAPSDSRRGADSRTRRVEAGASVIAAPPGGVRVVLQMPRGNFETVAPRALVLPAVLDALDARRYADAHALASRHRIDLNLLVDWAWPRFLEEADAFVADVDDPEALMELVESLDERDATGPGGIYEHACAERRRKEARITREKASREGGDANHDGDVLRTPAMFGAFAGAASRFASAVGAADDSKAAAFFTDGAKRADAAVGRALGAMFGGERVEGGGVPGGGVPGEGVPDGDGGGDSRGESKVNRCVAAIRAAAVARRAPAPKPVDDSDAALDGDLTPRSATGGAGTYSPFGGGSNARASAPTSPSFASRKVLRVDPMDPDEAEERAAREAAREKKEAAKLAAEYALRAGEDSPLVDDKWELLVLSCFARADPPEMAAALRRVSRRRREEISAAAEAEISSDGGEGGIGGADGEGGGGDASGVVDPGSSDRRLFSDEMLQHLLALEGGRKLFDAALGTYDLALAYLVGKASPEMSPDDFVPELERLEAMPDALRRADVDERLGRFESAVANFVEGGQSAGAIAVAKARRLFPLALSKATELAEAAKANAARLKAFAADVAANVAAGGSSAKEAEVASASASASATAASAASSMRGDIAVAYADQLSSESRHEDAAVTLLSVGEALGAMRAYASALAHRPALALAGRLGVSAAERTQLAEELAEGLELTDPKAAASVVERELRDVDRAVALLCRARDWRESQAAAYANGRGDLVDTVIAPAAAEAATAALEHAREAPGRADKYLERLAKLEARRLARGGANDLGALSGGEEDGEVGSFAGFDVRRKLGRSADPDADPASFLSDDDASLSDAASLSTLATGVTDMSAYTDGTTARHSERSNSSSSSSGVASTVGGRKQKKLSRKERRGRKKGGGLRAGGPTEARDLATFLAEGGTCPDLLAEGALDEIGQLSELLVTLGASDDAAKLQRAVGEALEAHERASRIARATLAALDDAERSAAAAAGRGPDPKRLDKPEPCECPACARSRKGKCLAAVAAQWKWAALRTGGSS